MVWCAWVGGRSGGGSLMRRRGFLGAMALVDDAKRDERCRPEGETDQEGNGHSYATCLCDLGERPEVVREIGGTEVVHRHPAVPVLAPGGAPGVADEDVVPLVPAGEHAVPAHRG